MIVFIIHYCYNMVVIATIERVVMKICCASGNRPHKFPWEYGEEKEHEKCLADLARQIEELIRYGHTYFISGGALDVDQDFAETVLRAKKIRTNIKLKIAVSCKKQDERWSESDKSRYITIIDKADKVTFLSEHYTRYCMQKRNEYMVDKSNLNLVYWNGEEKGST
ncbi:MAG: DUF1273 family protein [Clostridiales bacterium]|nr:DUF1273 family protein [Clostridiales bacterium]